MLSITAVLSLFSLLVLSSMVYYLAKRLRVPYTVLLVLVGILLVPFTQLPGLESVFGFIDDLTLTPELLFYIFLPILIFESGFNMSIRKMLDSAWSISLLAFVGMLISTVLIATSLYFVLPLVGYEIPFIVTLLFGAIISSTDPVAVLALFKEFGAPKRLTMIFEGESLFNDGTAVALFLVFLAIATDGFHGASTVLEGVGMFSSMVLLGIAFGIVMATIFSRTLKYTRDNDFVTVTLLIISAHLVFILSELINQHGLFGWHIHISPIIATTVSSLFLGNYARLILPPKTDEYTTKFIEHIAFMANSLVFVLAGLLFASSGIEITKLWAPILVTVFIVAIVRLIQIFAVTTPLNYAKLEAPIPRPWQLILAWGSLRGALAIIIVLLIPDDLAISGWQYAYTPKEFLLALTIGCILATLFIKAPLMGPIMRRLGITKPEPLHEAYVADLGLYYLLAEKSRFATEKEQHFIESRHYDQILKQINQNIATAQSERDELLHAHGQDLFEQSLHIIMLNLEQHALKELLLHGEVSEKVFRRINGKLSLQKEKIEQAQHDAIDPAMHTDRKDIFDRLVHIVQDPFDKQKGSFTVQERMQFYRAQMLMSLYAQQRLKAAQRDYATKVFYKAAYDIVLTNYETYRQSSAKKLEKLLAAHANEVSSLLMTTATRSIAGSGMHALDNLSHLGIINEITYDEIIERWGAQS